MKDRKNISNTADTVSKLSNKRLKTLKDLLPFKSWWWNLQSQLPSPYLTFLCSWKNLFGISLEIDKNLFLSSVQQGYQVYEMFEFTIQFVIRFISLILASSSSILNVIKIFNKCTYVFCLCHEESQQGLTLQFAISDLIEKLHLSTVQVQSVKFKNQLIATVTLH